LLLERGCSAADRVGLRGDLGEEWVRKVS